MDHHAELQPGSPTTSRDPTVLGHQANDLLMRFERLGNLTDLDLAIQYQTQAVSLTPNTHGTTGILLNELGIMLGHRFARLGNLADLTDAIEHQQRALSLLPQGHTEQAKTLNALGLSRRRRYLRLGNPEDIDLAIEHQRRAATVVNEGDVELVASIFNHLGNSLGLRLERTGNLQDIEEAIELQSRCINITSHDHPERPKFLNNLGNSFWRRFDRLGNLGDLSQAIEYRQQAVLLLPTDYPDKHRFLNNLGVAFLGRFEHLADLSDLDEAIRNLQEVIKLRPANHPDRCGPLNNLAICFQRRHERLSQASDIDQAIRYQQEAILATPDGHVRIPTYLLNMGRILLARYQHLGIQADPERAIESLRQADSLLPDRHIEKPRALLNLGNAYRLRFGLSGSKFDINEAIKCHQLSLSLMPNDYTIRSHALSFLGTSFQTRFEWLGDLSDCEEAIRYHSAAISATPAGSIILPTLYFVLASAYRVRFDHMSDLSDIDKSIEFHKKANSSAPEDHLHIAHWLGCTGDAIERRAQHSGDRTYMTEAIECFQRAAQAPRSPALHRFKAARSWIRLLAQQPDASTLDAYQLAMGFLPLILWQGNTIRKRYLDAIHIGDFVTEATGAAFAAGQSSLAAEWFEAGRSIVWKQRLQLRQSVKDLYPADHVLARRIETVMNELAAVEALDYGVYSPDQAMRGEEAAQKHRQLAEDLSVLITYGNRKVPGFEDFSKPKMFAQLANAARLGPVVIVNIHSTRCDALALLIGGDTKHIPIGSYSHEKAKKAHSDWTRNLKLFGVRERGIKRQNDSKQPSRAIFARILTELWVDLIRPILECLGFMRINRTKPLPHLTWCTTGPLTFLPIHAAGSYSSMQPRERIFDYVVSSYTPTLSAMMVPAKYHGQFRGTLAIGLKTTPEKSDLPYALEEVERVHKVMSGMPFQRLIGSEATIESVLGGLEGNSWVHFACHATQDVGDPNESGFFLHDGKLNLAMITKQPLKHASLAYLSACETATGDAELPGEAIHLAAGMLMAGFGTVIATMWAMRDDHGPVVAERVYAELLMDGVPDSRQAAEALHNAVAYLRDRVGEDRYEEWAPFIHMGI
ncbi:hypothetical protein FRC09_000681 [Ceratobasidium sp. 395]|nr:hypothetical protein FRC09_000681 [Ceratobasidium sp. 395]